MEPFSNGSPQPYKAVRYKRERSGGVHTFDLDRVIYTPIHPNSGWLVYVENRSYAGFDTEQEAQDAVVLWKAYWPAIRGMVITIMPRLS